MDAIKTLTRKDEMTFEQMQKHIGGYLEVIFLPKDKTNMVLDGDGRLKGLPINREASEIWRANFGNASQIVGNVIILKDDARIKRR